MIFITWSEGLSSHARQLTRTGKIPELMRASMGGFRSDDRSFRAAWTAASWMAGSVLLALSTMVSKLAVDRFSRMSSSSEKTNKLILFRQTKPVWFFPNPNLNSGSKTLEGYISSLANVASILPRKIKKVAPRKKSLSPNPWSPIITKYFWKPTTGREPRVPRGQRP